MAIDKSKFLGPFKAETKEHLGKLNEGILQLEKDPGNTEILDALMREAHTVKGSATMMGFLDMAEIAHKLEDGFENASQRDVALGQGGYDLLFECLDLIESLLEGTVIRQAKSLESDYIQSLCAHLEASFAAGLPPAAPASQAAEPAASDPDPEPDSESAAPASPEPEGPAPASPAPPASEARTVDPAPSSTPDPSRDRTAPGSPRESIRVEVERLDHLMNLSGEMLTARTQLNALLKRLTEKVEEDRALEESLGALIREIGEVDDTIRLVISDIQDETLGLRMLPVSYLFGTFPRAMRDLAKQHGKELELVTQGEDTRLDKNIIDRMRDPLMHLLRNAVDHGIETPAVRDAAGKPTVGTLTLNAYQAGAQVVLEIRDDGAGIDVERVRRRALERGLLSGRYAEQVPDDQLYSLLFSPGFTTCDVVTETSGRGVGLDVVSDQIRQLKGQIEIVSTPGQGTCFVIRLPLTLAITETLLVACGADVFALPIDTIVETTRIRLDEIDTVEAKEVMALRGEIIPLVRIHQLFSLPKKGIIEKRYYPVVIVQCGERRLGLLVDEILGHQDTVIKPLGDPLHETPNIAGGTVGGDGRVVLILDVPAIVFTAGNEGHRAPGRTVVTELDADNPQRRILLAEDTPSTAMLERSILEAAGFQVAHAHDGQEALEMASQNPYDLVISDVLMPRMNGFELTAHLKGDARTCGLPVVIVTTRGSDADKRRGLEAGADAYILKKDFTSDSFLETLDRLLT